MRRIVFVAVCMFLVAGFGPTSRAQVRVEIRNSERNESWLRAGSSAHENSVVTLQATTYFTQWQDAATTMGRFFAFPIAPDSQLRFYRLHVGPVGSTNDWKNEALFPDEPFIGPDSFDVRWAKFAILRDDPSRVYFQDSAEFLFHFDFASRRLPPFIGMTPMEFDAVSLHRANQQVILGSVLYPRDPSFSEYGIQFVGRDPYTPQEISRWFELVKASVYAAAGGQALYMPVYEQAEVARTNAAEFAALRIPVASIDRWVPLNHVYSAGWGLGTLRYFAAGEVAAAFGDGRLRPQDILLTDGVPAETPLVAGIISLSPSTPNSHTALLSQSFAIPFVHLPDAADQARAQGLAGRKVILRASSSFWGGTVKLLDVEGALSPELEAEILALKLPQPIAYTPKQRYGAISASAEDLGPADIRFFGGKAANYGLLRDSVPNNSPRAIAFSFDLWDAFMDQTLPSGQTLRAAVAARLAAHASYPPNIPAMKSDLAAVRDLIRRTAAFNTLQRLAIINALSVFEPGRNIRFRSSTNVEDSETFTGAGLYDSYSGCLMDDLDEDNAGPSQCDPTEDEERGVFRAIQRVYASFYNDNAYLERLRHAVNEDEVGMGVLVHHSFPDNDELANGVANLAVSFMGSFTNVTGTMVTQLGAESVTNPDGTSIPELVNVSRFNTSSFLTLSRRSSLVPLGAYVMNWEQDYRSMLDLLTAAGLQMRRTFPTRSDFHLNFEYKKDVNLGLVVKQVRQVPQPSVAQPITAFLIHEPTTWCVAQWEFSDVFANHRLKSIWNLATVNARMTPANLAGGIHTTGVVQYVANGIQQSISGAFDAWPNASRSPDAMTNQWTTGAGADIWNWELVTQLTTEATPPDAPIFTQQDFRKTVTVRYPRPMPRISPEGEVSAASEETVHLWPCPELTPGAMLREYSFASAGGARVETSFYWPRSPSGPTAGYTAPLVRFVETRITGLTTEPVVLRAYFSQTYHPFHHNFVEEFIFEPRLEPGLSAATLQQLNAANIQLIYARRGDDSMIRVLGLDGRFREL